MSMSHKKDARLILVKKCRKEQAFKCIINSSKHIYEGYPVSSDNGLISPNPCIKSK